MLNPEKKLNEKQIIFLQVISSLTFREVDILMNRYILGYNLNDLALKYKIERERIRQIENGALQKITLHSNLNKVSFKDKQNKRQ